MYVSRHCNAGLNVWPKQMTTPWSGILNLNYFIIQWLTKPLYCEWFEVLLINFEPTDLGNPTEERNLLKKINVHVYMIN